MIDVAEEIARLEKTLGKLAKELGGLRGRLKNPKFAESAPPEVVEETKANLALREEEESKLQEALTRLKELCSPSSCQVNSGVWGRAPIKQTASRVSAPV